MREWFAHLERLRDEHRIVLSYAWAGAEGRVFAVGSLSLAGEPDIGSVWALHRIDGQRIAAVYQYLSDADVIGSVGLVP